MSRSRNVRNEAPDRFLVEGGVLAYRSVGAAARLDAPDPLGRQRARPYQELRVLFRIDVVRHDAYRELRRKRLAKPLDERRLPRADRASYPYLYGSFHDLLLRLEKPGKQVLVLHSANLDARREGRYIVFSKASSPPSRTGRQQASIRLLQAARRCGLAARALPLRSRGRLWSNIGM